jgi:hypothetical protein
MAGINDQDMVFLLAKTPGNPSWLVRTHVIYDSFLIQHLL